MRIQRTIAAAICSALIIGCGGRSNDNSQNNGQIPATTPATGPATADQPVASAAPASPQQAYTAGDRLTAREETPAPSSGRRATSSRPNASRNGAATSAAPSQASLPA